jgi:hypothetical protein
MVDHGEFPAVVAPGELGDFRGVDEVGAVYPQKISHGYFRFTMDDL